MEVVDALLGFGGHGPLDPDYVCIHETAGPGAPALNVVGWWRGGGGLPVHYVGDWTGKCYRCVPEDEVCWQVGNGNSRVVGIELCHATNADDFAAVWRLGVEWAAWQLSKRGWGTDRLVSHRMAAEMWGGSDHTDPDGYFAEFGRSWGEFAADVDAELRRGEAGEEAKEEPEMPTRIETPEGARAVRRLYDPSTGEHLYTTDSAERRRLARRGWRDEGAAWTTPAHGSAPVYRLYMPGGKHLWTADYAEACALVAGGWECEGVKFWAAATGKPVYRLYRAADGDHLLTMSKAERKSAKGLGYAYEGVAFRV